MEIVYFHNSALLHRIWKYILQKFVLLCYQKAWYTLMSFFITVTYIDHKADHFSYFFIQFSTTSNMYMHSASTLPPSYLPSTLVKLRHTAQFLVTEFSRGRLGDRWFGTIHWSWWAHQCGHSRGTDSRVSECIPAEYPCSALAPESLWRRQLSIFSILTSLSNCSRCASPELFIIQ